MVQDELEQQSEEGSFTSTGRMDILAIAIGKLDHPGQVRGEPRGVGLSRYFGRASSYSKGIEPSEEFIAKVEQEVELRLRRTLLDMEERHRQEIVEVHCHFEDLLASKLASLQSLAFPSTKGNSKSPPLLSSGDPTP